MCYVIAQQFEDDDLGPVTDRTCRVQGCTVTASSRGVRGRHCTSDVPSTLNSLPAGFIMIQVHPVYDPYLHAHIVRPHIPYRSSAQEPLNEFSGPVRKLGIEYYGISSSEPFIGRPLIFIF
ncbi:hypothetical protein M9H77_17981 [Catharanthus roseus]|uniref:Uncharacterized protein n=1 Tax=Catharanthus roseus TaxID=4058 RepID=A0ACC0B673_CATRO|nr:hypothetical protein M9H77_17981 [Catharanthus roseus]